MIGQLDSFSNKYSQSAPSAEKKSFGKSQPSDIIDMTNPAELSIKASKNKKHNDILQILRAQAAQSAYQMQ